MEILLLVFVIVWLTGAIHLPGIVFQTTPLFIFRGLSITIMDILIFLGILWAIEMLPSPLRQVIVILGLLWLLSLTGLISIAGASTYIVWAVIIAAVVAIIKR